jgi:predicted DNA-binding WGR domain protein
MEDNITGSIKRKASSLSEQPATTPEPNSESRENEKELDEQMERFYALLENIKAMRHAWGGRGSSGTSCKKLKSGERTVAEVPWRPTFRLEDFMQGEDSRITERQIKKEDGGAERSECDES